MKIKTLGILSALVGSLAVSGPGSAAFVGIKVVQRSEAQPLGLFVCQVYAVFDNPQDQVLAVMGTPEAPLNIEAFGSFGGL